MKKLCFLFPGQGSQYSKMGYDFYSQFSAARESFEAADDILKRPLSTLIFNGAEQELTETKNSQPAIYVTSIAILRVIQTLFPEIIPTYTAGLSLGEYTALTAAEILRYEDALTIVQARGLFMHECCEKYPGTMAVVLGMKDEEVEACVRQLNMPKDIWAANFNCPGQVVISGTQNGITACTQALLKQGAKRVLPLQVHGAFHSGLMNEAAKKLEECILTAPLYQSSIQVAMNVCGDLVTDITRIRQLLIAQVTQSVRWSHDIQAIEHAGVDAFIEIGCGKTLTGMNKRIGTKAPTYSIETVADLTNLESILRGDR